MSNKCQNCKHEWIARSLNRSKQCPYCRTVNWDSYTPKKSYEFEKIEIDQEIIIPWWGGLRDRPKIYRALKAYQYRSGKKFRCVGDPKGLLIRRIL